MVLRFFMLAGVFFFISCGTIERDNPNDPGSDDYRGYQVIYPQSSSTPSSSSFAQSSSSVVVSSSSSIQSSSSSFAVVTSSSSKPSSSSSAPRSSSSSVVKSSSSVEVSSSSSIPSSSSSEPPSSSSLAQSSSSAVEPSSSSILSSSSGPCAGFVNGTKREHYGKEKEQFCDPRDGKKYVYVTIGTQTWMAENLNYNASGSKCGGDGNTDCDTYGRLYYWATAMVLPVSCNTSFCSSQIYAGHQGICPSGWHIPSNTEWITLTSFVGGSSNAGKYLKTSDWNGNDKHGFAALLGGLGHSAQVGSGYWWTDTEYSGYKGSAAYYQQMNSDNDGVIESYATKDQYLFSIRCLQD